MPAVSAPQQPQAAQVIAHTAEERGAPLTLVGRDWQWESLHISSEEQQFSAWSDRDEVERTTYTLPLLGRHQQVNGVTALATVAQLRQQGVDVPEKAVRSGLAAVRWPGRIEVLGQRPWVIVDGAHNGDSMQKLCAALDEPFPHGKTIFVWGASAGKDLDGMLDALIPAADHILVTQSRHPRAADPQLLIEQIRARGRSAQAVSVDTALEQALSLAQTDDLICGTGSLFVVADLRAAWFRHRGQPLPPSDTE